MTPTLGAPVRLSPKLRDMFDETVEAVLRDLPREARDLLKRVPLLVEDRPNAVHSEALGGDDELFGLYTGVPLTERSVENAGEPAEVIRVYREGLLAVARDQRGQLEFDRLQEEIRVTVLHELGHHFGLSDSRLAELGY